jgi:hypothetical protein
MDSLQNNSKSYNIVQEKSVPGKTSKKYHITSGKTAIRTIQSHVKGTSSKYLNEYFID